MLLTLFDFEYDAMAFSIINPTVYAEEFSERQLILNLNRWLVYWILYLTEKRHLKCTVPL